MKHSKILTFFILLISLVLVGCKQKTNNNSKLDGLTLTILTEKTTYYQGDNIIVDINISEDVLVNNVKLEILNSESDVIILKNVIVPSSVGEIKIVARIENIVSNEITINVENDIYSEDPYSNMPYDLFYENYEESINLKDSYYRSLHGLMSGNLKLPEERQIRFSHL